MASKKIRARNNKANKKGKQLPSMVKGVVRSRVEGPSELPEGTKTFTTLTEDDIILLIALVETFFKNKPVFHDTDESYFQLDNSIIGEGDRIVMERPDTGQHYCYTFENLLQWLRFIIEKNGCREQK